MSASAPALFADLALRSPAPEVVRLDSTGYAVEGRGAASYIADALATEALLAGHPRFVFRSANDRIFRLVTEAGSIAVEQGGATGDGAANDQPAIQAGINYAETVGARELRFESARYVLHCPVRTSPSSHKRAENGHPLVVRQSLALRGNAPDRSVLDFRGVGGVDPETDWQIIPTSAGNPAPTVWRGGGLFLKGDIVDPAPSPRRIARIELDRLVFQGNRRHTGNYVWPANPVSGDGWDISDKALWSQDCLVGAIVCRDVDMIGWKGEIFYLSGVQDAVESVELVRCRLLTTNGSAFNPSPDAQILAIDCEFGDCFQAQEDVGKTRAVYRNCLWRNCDHMGLGGGPTAEYLYSISWPTRDPDRPVPQTILEDCEFRDIVALRFANWVRGTARTIDTTVILDGPTAMALHDVELEIDAWLDRKTSIHALIVYGTATLTDAVPGASDGVYKIPPGQVRVRMRHHRTRLAEEQGHEWLGMFWVGYVDRHCRFDIEGDLPSNRTPNGGDNPISMPLVTWGGGQASNANTALGYYQAAPLSESGTLVPSGPVMALMVTGEVTVDLSLANYPVGGAEYGYANGQRLRLVKQYDNGAIRIAKGAAPLNVCVMATRVLDLAYDWIEFVYNRDRGRWEESGFFSAV